MPLVFRYFATLGCLLLLGACSGGETESPQGPDAGIGQDSDAGPDLTAEMFRPDHVLDIQIEMAASDWDQLRVQARTIFDVLGASCNVSPPIKPFTYFPATVTIDGETVTQVGVRKKGFFGSLSETKPSLKLKFSEYLPEQRFSGMKRLTLNNNKSDISHIKQCIGYQLFAKAGVPAPRCSFATVTVNGNNLGIFTHVESIKKPFIRRHFADDSGNMYEGALSDFRAGWVDTFQRKTNKVEPGMGTDDRSDIDSLVSDMQSADDEFLDRVGAKIDIDAFLTMWAMEVLMMHADGYARNTNNFYLYDDPSSGLFHFIPWGIDSILFNNQALPWEDAPPPESVWTEGVLARRLYMLPEIQVRYLERLEEMLADVWDESELIAEIDRMTTLLQPYLLAGSDDGFENAVTGVRNFIDDRRSQLRAELDLQPSPSPVSELRAPWCLAQIGTLDVSFATTWTSDLAASNPFSDGSCSITSTVPGYDLLDQQGGATVGIDPDSGNPSLRFVTWLSVAADPQTESSVALVIGVGLSPDQLAPQTLMLDGPQNAVNMLKIVFPPAGAPLEFEIVGMVGQAVLELSQASEVEGAAWSGTLTGDVYQGI